MDQNDGPGSEPGVPELPRRQRSSSPEASRTNEAHAAERVGHKPPEYDGVGHVIQSEPQKALEGLNTVHQNAQASLNAIPEEPETVATTATPATSACAIDPKEESSMMIQLSFYLSEDFSGKASKCVLLPRKDVYTGELLYKTLEKSLEGLYDDRRELIVGVCVQRADGKKIQGCPHDRMPFMRAAAGRGGWERLLKLRSKDREARENGLYVRVEMRSIA